MTTDLLSPTLIAAGRVIVEPMSLGMDTKLVSLDGKAVGDVNGRYACIYTSASPARGFWFPDEATAVEAIVSSAVRGWWTGESPSVAAEDGRANATGPWRHTYTDRSRL